MTSLQYAFLDADLVVRYLTSVPPELAYRAAEIIDHVEGLVVAGVTIAEAAYVLMRVYQLPRQLVMDQLMELIQKENIAVHEIEKGVLIQGLLLCRPSGRVSVADGLIWASARSAGVQIIYSFDERFPADGVEVRRGP